MSAHKLKRKRCELNVGLHLHGFGIENSKIWLTCSNVVDHDGVLLVYVARALSEHKPFFMVFVVYAMTSAHGRTNVALDPFYAVKRYFLTEGLSTVCAFVHIGSYSNIIAGEQKHSILQYGWILTVMCNIRCYFAGFSVKAGIQALSCVRKFYVFDTPSPPIINTL